MARASKGRRVGRRRVVDRSTDRTHGGEENGKRNPSVCRFCCVSIEAGSAVGPDARPARYRMEH
ncbi:hypothetical protein CXQ84_14425 [Burkholderia pseudomallei]|nr:hypothetical protein CXQ84_14425 [Burkholderia pseudomallei]